MQIVNSNYIDYILKELKEASNTWEKDRFELIAAEIKNFLECPFKCEDFSDETFRLFRIIDQRTATIIRRCKFDNTKESLECLPYLMEIKGFLELFRSLWVIKKKDFEAEIAIRGLNNPKVVDLLKYLENEKFLSLSEICEWGKTNGNEKDITKIIDVLRDGGVLNVYLGRGEKRYSIASPGIRYLNHLNILSKEKENIKP